MLTSESGAGWEFPPIGQHIAKNAAAIFISSTLLLGGQPQAATALDPTVSGALQKAIIEASDATYPLLQALDSTSTASFSTKVSNVIAKKLNPDRLTNVVDSATSAVLAIPDDRISKFTTIVEDAYQGVSSDTCQYIAIPASAIEKVALSDGLQKVDAEKLSQALEKVALLQRAVPVSSSADSGGICLPKSQEALENIWVGQTELLLSVPKAAKKELGERTKSAIRSIPGPEALRLANDAKNIVTGSGDRKIASRFLQTGQALDKLIQQDPRFQAFQSPK